MAKLLQNIHISNKKALKEKKNKKKTSAKHTTYLHFS